MFAGAALWSRITSTFGGVLTAVRGWFHRSPTATPLPQMSESHTPSPPSSSSSSSPHSPTPPPSPPRPQSRSLVSHSTSMVPTGRLAPLLPLSPPTLNSLLLLLKASIIPPKVTPHTSQLTLITPLPALLTHPLARGHINFPALTMPSPAAVANQPIGSLPFSTRYTLNSVSIINEY